MQFHNMSFEIQGITEVRIDGDLYTRQTASQTTNGGKIIVNKYFRREKDGHMIHEHKFIKKLHRLQSEGDSAYYKRPHIDKFGNVSMVSDSDYVPKWRFWFSGNTINVERILV